MEEDMTWRIDQGDCRELLRAMPDESFTACLTDPPYGLSFMGKNWDHGVPGVAYWAEVLRVLRPGAVLMAFGGTRTHHRLMVAIEDAGFEIFDMMMWLYGQGFPKSTDISKQLDKEERSRWLKIAKAVDNLTDTSILEAWKEYLETAKSVGLRFAKNATGIGTSTPENAFAPEPVMLSVSPEKSYASAILAELRLSEAHPMYAVAKTTVLRDVAANAQQNPARSAGSQPPSARAKPMLTGIALCDVKELASESMAGKLKGGEALRIWLGKNKSSRQRDISALCAALTDDLKLTILSQSKTFRSLDTIQRTDFVSATSVTITESIAECLISFTADMLRNEAINKAAGAEREVVGTKLDQPGYSLADHGQTNEVYGNLHSPVAECSVTSSATPDAETWQGYGTALKPAWEPIVLARKPRLATYAATAVEHGSGALWIDGGRVGTTVETWPASRSYAPGQLQPGGKGKTQATGAMPNGRWPANLLLSHSPGCVRRGERRVKSDRNTQRNPERPSNPYHLTAPGFDNSAPVAPWGYADADGLETIADWDCVPDCAVRLLGEQSGVRPGFRDQVAIDSGHTSMFGLGYNKGRGFNDTGTAARFFKNFDPPTRFCYLAKASRAERDAGLSDGERCVHPCVKPLAVTRYLAALLLPPKSYLDDAVLLVPFCGVGSEIIGALRAGWRHVVGIELSEEYAEMARRRIVADSPLWNHNGG